MNTNEINIRDPYVLLHGGKYYLYGTRSYSCWGPADGFDCYVSTDLENWEGPFEIFHRPDGFFADRSYWAPECYYHEGRFYLLVTLGAEDRKKGIYVLTSDNPMGPFVAHSDKPLTPKDWACIDGSLYFGDNGIPYLLFSHSFEDNRDGEMCVLELSGDLCEAVSDPRLIFNAVEAPWATPIPFAKDEFHIDDDVYFTDGPCVRKLSDGALSILWASWSERGYAVGQAISPSGDIYGPWEHLEQKLFPENGGHGMLFESMGGQLLYTLHYPNDRFKEHPIFEKVIENKGILKLVR